MAMATDFAVARLRTSSVVPIQGCDRERRLGFNAVFDGWLLCF